LDAWFAERVGELPEAAQRTFPFLYVAKPSRREKNAGLDATEKKAKREVYGKGFSTATKVDPKFHTVDGMERRPLHTNHHPTVKAVKLMHYLITLASRPGDVVLDPFCGSGSTGVAAMNLQRSFFGVELDPEYVEIAKARMRHARRTPAAPTKKPKRKDAKEKPTRSLWAWKKENEK
jgi:site-specific DNA-methyltransferase (adenine-specific)